MAPRKKKTAPAKKRTACRRRLPGKRSLSGELFRVAVGFVLLVALVVAAGALVHRWLKPQMPSPSASRPAPPVAESRPQTRKAPPQFEIYPERDEPVRAPTTRKKALPEPGLPKVSLILDDLGYDQRTAERFFSLDAVLTASILPHGPFSKRIARMAEQRGWEIMLHLPMEPDEYPAVDPGPGALLTTMTADELLFALNRNLDSLPSVRGVNNHMGSKMTTRSDQLYQVFSTLRQRGMYFIDSRTTPGSLCRPSARLFQLPFAQRDVFIDHRQDPAFIRRQLRQLVETAESHGEAIGIAHPHRLTSAILEEMLPEMKERVKLVPASQVVHPAG